MRNVMRAAAFRRPLLYSPASHLHRMPIATMIAASGHERGDSIQLGRVRSISSKGWMKVR